MDFKRKMITAAATGSVLLFTLTPLAYADTSIEISGNGANSDNSTTVSQTSTSTVTQSNSAAVNNNVSSNTNTGGNKANDNTGGNVTVKTGDSSQTTDVSTKANVNQATTSNCNCAGDTNVLISGNGAHSDNDATVSKTNTQAVYQNNAAAINNNVSNTANTGDNHANGNTGGSNGAGSVTVTTGDTTQRTSVDNAANANIVTPANVLGTSTGGTVSARILGNGAHSDNDLDLTLTNSALVEQNNAAEINNNVSSNQNTGDNHAKDNTGAGTVSISTGDANSTTDVSNMANFNSADTDCGCLMNVTAKVANNGTDTDNAIDAALANGNSMFQTNGADLNNSVDPSATTGDNKASGNTAATLGMGDPSVTTGDANSHTSVDNQANLNQAGQGSMLTLPGGTSLSFGFDMTMFATWLHSMGF